MEQAMARLSQGSVTDDFVNQLAQNHFERIQVAVSTCNRYIWS